MSINQDNLDFFAKINKIVNYFSRTKKGGFLFCSCNNTLVIKHIVQLVITRSAEKNLKIKELYLSSSDTGSFLYQAKAAAEEQPDGIIIANLDEMAVLTKDQIIIDINLSRDILLDIKIPFLFCMSRENISKFANQAVDLFLRRDRGVIQFPDIPEHPLTAVNAMTVDMKEFFPIKFPKFNSFKDLELTIGLLHGHLQEGEEKKYNPDRIANETALDLIEAYIDASYLEKANELFNKYKMYFNLEEYVKAISVAAYLYEANADWDRSLVYYFKLKAMHETVENMVELAIVLNNIGIVYFYKGEMDKAFEYFSKTGELCKKEGNITWKASVLNNTGLIYSVRNELDKALDFFLKSIEIWENIGDTNNLGCTFNNTGKIYAKKGEWDKAFDYYLKGKKAFEKSGDIQHLKLILKNMEVVTNHLPPSQSSEKLPGQ
jgi:Tfp pilus assembly protein PilF